MKTLFLLTLIFNFTLANAQDYGIKQPCPDPTQVKQTQLTQAILDCKFQEKLAGDIKDIHQNLIYKKLSQKLATRIKQNSEEFSLLTSFFNSNGKDLMMNNKEIGQHCRIENFRNENKICGKRGTSTQFQTRLNFLKDSLPSNKNTPFKDDDSLYGAIAGKFYTDLGMKERSSNPLQCPILKENGDFSLQSQLDEASAIEIVSELNNPAAVGKDRIYNKYAQLKLIINSSDINLAKDFREHIKKIDLTKDNAKNIISQFFFDEKNRDGLANALANQCQQMNKNIETFLCSDLENLESMDNIASQGLFDGLRTDKPIQDQDIDFDKPGVLTAYGLQCIAKDKLKKGIKSKNNNNVDKWFKDFTENTRTVSPKDTSASNSRITNFCKMYSCESEKAQETKSCKNGGPISSMDLEEVLGCKKDCIAQSHKMVDLLRSIEKMKESRDAKSSLSAADKKNDDTPRGKLPNFAENFFGAEGTLKALEVKVSPQIIAERSKEIEDRRNTLSQSYPINSINSVQPTDSPAIASASQKTVSPEPPAESMDIQPTYVPSTPTTPSSQNAIRTSSTSTTKSTASQSVKIQGQSGNSDESSRLRREMEGMLDDLRKSSADSSEESVAVSPVEDASRDKDDSSSSRATSGTKSLSSEERRLKKWADDLNYKERNLDQYARELANREYSSPSEADRAFQPVSARGNNSPGINIGKDMPSSSGGSPNGGLGSPGLKLSASGTSKEEQKANTAAIIQSDKESSSISVDELTKLSPDNLKTFGIDATKPFTLRVNFKDKTYEVPVKSFVHNGANVLGPVIDPKNKDLKEFLFKSPLFKSYLQYRMERESII